jgi:hypothetical protein
VSSSVQERGPRPGRRPEPAGEAVERQDQADPPQGDVEARERVPGVGPGPAPGCGAHEVGPEVIAERESRDSRDLGRLACQELVSQPHVEGRVERHEGVQKEVAGRGLDPVPRVLRERQEGHERQGGSESTSERRAGGALERPASRDPRPDQQGHDRRWKDGRDARHPAQPEGEGAECRPQGHGESRVEGGPDEPL